MPHTECNVSIDSTTTYQYPYEVVVQCNFQRVFDVLFIKIRLALSTETAVRTPSGRMHTANGKWRLDASFSILGFDF